MEDPNQIVDLLLKNNNKDLIITALNNMDDKTVLSLCQVNKQLYDICKDDKAEWMWKNRFLKRFGETPASYKLQESSWRQYFLDLLYLDLDKDFYLNNAISKAAEKNRFDLVKFFSNELFKDVTENIYSKYLKRFIFTNALISAAATGNMEMIEYLISQGGEVTYDAVLNSKDLKTLKFFYFNKYGMLGIDYHTIISNALKKQRFLIIDDILSSDYLSNKEFFNLFPLAKKLMDEHENDERLKQKYAYYKDEFAKRMYMGKSSAPQNYKYGNF